MSDKALVAAMRPKSNGSSTTGMKKSVVATMAWLSFSRQTAASSPVSVPTSNAGSAGRPNVDSTSASRPGASLQAQPAP